MHYSSRAVLECEDQAEGCQRTRSMWEQGRAAPSSSTKTILLIITLLQLLQFTLQCHWVTQRLGVHHPVGGYLISNISKLWSLYPIYLISWYCFSCLLLANYVITDNNIMLLALDPLHSKSKIYGSNIFGIQINFLIEVKWIRNTDGNKKRAWKFPD